MKWLTPTRRGDIDCPTNVHAVNAARKGGPAIDHSGVDVHKKESQICMLLEGGEAVESRVRTAPERFADVLADRRRTLRGWCGSAAAQLTRLIAALTAVHFVG